MPLLALWLLVSPARAAEITLIPEIPAPIAARAVGAAISDAVLEVNRLGAAANFGDTAVSVDPRVHVLLERLGFGSLEAQAAPLPRAAELLADAVRPADGPHAEKTLAAVAEAIHGLDAEKIKAMPESDLHAVVSAIWDGMAAAHGSQDIEWAAARTVYEERAVRAFALENLLLGRGAYAKPPGVTVALPRPTAAKREGGFSRLVQMIDQALRKARRKAPDDTVKEASRPAPSSEPTGDEYYAKRYHALKGELEQRDYKLALKALDFARRLHVGKRKDGTTPEFQHQVEIALYLLTLHDVMRDPELVLAAALLHDVMEDYGVGRTDMFWRFGPRVAEAVWNLTKEYRGVKKDPEVYFAELALDPIASLVKGGDRIHNVQSMKRVFTPEKKRIYIEEVKRWILPMLKLAQENFPDQIYAYRNIRFVLKSQVDLYEP